MSRPHEPVIDRFGRNTAYKTPLERAASAIGSRLSDWSGAKLDPGTQERLIFDLADAAINAAWLQPQFDLATEARIANLIALGDHDAARSLMSYLPT